MIPLIDVFKKIRERRRIKACDLAESMGMARRSLYNYEEKHVNLPFHIVEKYCKAFNLGIIIYDKELHKNGKKCTVWRL